MPKRGSPMSYAARAKRARLTGTMTSGVRRNKMRGLTTTVRRIVSNKVVSKVNNLYRMIETKESTRASATNQAIAHNNLIVVQDANIAAALNPFRISIAAGDPMAAGDGARIGDQITLKGMLIRGMVENALARPRVYYRIMLLRGSKGETFDRATIFKGASTNKMLDQVNTERFSIIAQKIFTATASNVAASGVEVANGAPLIATAGGQSSKTFKFWIPGVKFGRGGNVQYENQNGTQVKFYDYRIIIISYDWFGTPQDLNNVGRLNELYTKLYFKDA